MTWLLSLWSNIAFIGCMVGIVAAWWYWPPNLPRWTLVALTAFLSAFGWGELRYADGRESGAVVERAKWEQSFAKLQADKATEKAQAQQLLDKAAQEAQEAAQERDKAREAARLSNARLLAELGRDGPQTTITCEKANETVQCPVCRSCYRQRVDPRILRNLKAGRGQE